jgi:hypothetical protein
MTITFGVKHLRSCPEAFKRRSGSIFVSGRLLHDCTGAWLYDLDSNDSVPICDDLACGAIRTSIHPPGDYIGGVLLQCFVRSGQRGAELHGIYWIKFVERDQSGNLEWGAVVPIRPVPPEEDAFR